ncbi:MAG: LacI family transcriptional regulator [Planctomycetota bacterium]|jgi:DNA-binding LacI/PurR family transcriptional regulator|nr:LacI family transcriptional regulator [Planctomycetota bacterium]
MSEKKNATIKDVAKSAGVSISSVSRYLADSQSIRPLAAYNIKKAIRELKFEPNAFARNLKKRHSDGIGIIVPFTDFFFGKFCAAVSDFFYERKFGAFICESDNDPDKERFYVQALLNLHVAGLLIAPTGHNSEFLREIVDRHRNIVVVDRREDIGCEMVAMDFEKNAFILTRHVLATYPCDRVLLLMGGQGAHMRDALKGIKHAFREKRASFAKVKLVYDCFRFVNVSEAVREFAGGIRDGERPVIMALGSSIMEDTITVLNQCGDGMPRRVDIAGFAMRNIIAKLGFHFPCVMQNPDKVGTTASELLFGKIADVKGKRKRKNGMFYEIEPEIRLEK